MSAFPFSDASLRRIDGGAGRMQLHVIVNSVSREIDDRDTSAAFATITLTCSMNARAITSPPVATLRLAPFPIRMSLL